MNRKLVSGIVGLALLIMATSAFAQGTQVVKSPPMRDSDTWTLTSLHPDDPNEPPGVPLPPAVPGTGWAGQRATLHVVDPNEVDVDAIVPLGGAAIRWPGSPGSPLPPGLYTGPIPDPFGPRSNNIASVPIVFTVIHPSAPLSGITLINSLVEPLFDIVLHAKNTNFGENSDTDVTLRTTDMWHFRDGPGSDIIHAQFSDHMWLQSSPSNWEQFHIVTPAYQSMYQLPQGPDIYGPEGHWVHIPDSLIFHTYPGPGSNYWLRGVTTYLLGIEHVPEPATIALIGLGGVFCTMMSVRSRMRRS